jgi:hypothetical protein
MHTRASSAEQTTTNTRLKRANDNSNERRARQKSNSKTASRRPIKTTNVEQQDEHEPTAVKQRHKSARAPNTSRRHEMDGRRLVAGRWRPLLLWPALVAALVIVTRPADSRGPQQAIAPIQQQQQPRAAPGRANLFAAAPAQPVGQFAAGRPFNQPTVMNAPSSQHQFQAPLVSSSSGAAAGSHATNYFGRHRGVALHQTPPAHPYNHQQRFQQQQPATTTSRHYQVPAMCHIQEHLKPYSRCLGRDEARLNGTALAEFRSKLEETSSDLRQLLELHLLEFRSHSLGLVLLARNETLNKLHHHHQQQQQAADGGGSAVWAQAATTSATKRLFDAMHAHLLSYQQLANGPLGGPSPADQQRPSSTVGPLDPLGQEISSYFKRVHLIQLKRMLDASLAAATNSRQQHMLVDFQCLDKNLPSQTHVEKALEELASSSMLAGGGAPDNNDSSSKSKNDNNNNALRYFSTPARHHLEQARLALAMKQSLEFARTLLGSLNLSAEMLNNITRRVDDWMPSQACHAALAQMTVCQECHVSSSAASAADPIGGIMSPAAVPCENYCLNVARGCMNDLYELNSFWAANLNALSQFQTNMIQSNNIENVMSSVDARLLNFLKRLETQYGTSGVAAGGAGGESNGTSDSPAETQEAQQEAIRLDQLQLSSEVSESSVFAWGA